MKKIISFLLVICLTPLFSLRSEASYNDIKGHWAEETINQAVSWGLISGYPNNSFSPDSPITLAELLTMLVPLVSGEKPSISDEDDWYLPYIEKAKQYGLLDGFTDGELEGFYDYPTMRAVANVLFANSLVSLGLAEKYTSVDKLADKASLGLLIYPDSKEIFGNLFTVATYSCVAHELIVGNDNRELQPYSYLTRAEAVTMLKRFKAYQTKRLNGMHYADPFTYSDYYFVCVKTASGLTFPIADAYRPIVKDNGIIYMSTVAIAKIMEACKMDFVVHQASKSDIYYGYYDSYITVPSSDFYAQTNAENNFYGYSNSYEGFISGPDGKKYDFACGADVDAGLVVRNIPMLPVKDVLDFFEISYTSIDISAEKTSVIVNFSVK